MHEIAATKTAKYLLEETLSGVYSDKKELKNL